MNTTDITDAENLFYPDELYTSYADVEHCLKRYKVCFRNKIVFCNCDDPFESAFFQYFARNFNVLQLKELISLSYCQSPLAQSELPLFYPVEKYRDTAYKINLRREKMTGFANEVIPLEDIKAYLLKYREFFLPARTSGDFRSYESMGILDKSDIVVTHPPLSLLPKFISLMLTFQKKFLILVNKSILKNPKIAEAMEKALLHTVPNKTCQNDFIYYRRGNNPNNNHPQGTTFSSANTLWLTNLKN